MTRAVRACETARANEVTLTDFNLVSHILLCATSVRSLSSQDAETGAGRDGTGGKKGKKRTREDDIPPATSRTMSIAKALQLLEAETECERHRGHYANARTTALDNHHRLDYGEKEYWVKQIVSES